MSWAVPNMVAYLNVDVAVAGPNFIVSGVPELHDIIIEVMKKIPAADGSSKTIYDDWAARSATVDVLGSGSDYTAFVHSGIASVRTIPFTERWKSGLNSGVDRYGLRRLRPGSRVPLSLQL